MDSGRRSQLTPKLIDSLYVEAMVLADEARSYFDDQAEEDRQRLEPLARVGFACESLRVTTRLMHVIAWLLTQRAVSAGEISAADARTPERSLGEAPGSDHPLVRSFPESARMLIQASEELYNRVRRLERVTGEPQPDFSPARTLMSRLERSL
jgi:regulator of CtrA degradation